MMTSSIIKVLVRRHIGLYPALEWRNRVVAAPQLPRHWFLENSEVARLRSTLPSKGLVALVAVVVPTYKRPELLQLAVASVLQQTLKDLVVLVVDDGGGLPALPFNDPRLFVVSLKRNSKVVGLVRNVGVRLTSSTYIAFLDDDNVWTEDHLATMLQVLAAQRASLALGTIVLVEEDGTEIEVLSGPTEHYQFREEGRGADASAILVRRDVRPRFSRLPRKRETIPGEDWVFAYKVSRRHLVARSNKATVMYLVHRGSFYSPWGLDT